jgi:hypothetical protein
MLRFNIYWYYTHLKEMEYLYNVVLITEPTTGTYKVYIKKSLYKPGQAVRVPGG